MQHTLPFVLVLFSLYGLVLGVSGLFPDMKQAPPPAKPVTGVIIREYLDQQRRTVTAVKLDGGGSVEMFGAYGEEGEFVTLWTRGNNQFWRMNPDLNRSTTK